MIFFGLSNRVFLPVEDQIRKWRQANRRMHWGIDKTEFENLAHPPFKTDELDDYWCGNVLCYGFGDDSAGNADAVLAGRLSWEYALKQWKISTWQCQYLDFTKPDFIRLDPQAPPRPKGFYFCRVYIPKSVQQGTVAQFRKNRSNRTGLGPEGLQLLVITHPHLQQALNERRLPCLVFADYDVAPHGFFDFYDAVQMFCSNDTLGLGIGNIDRNYPLFAIPYLQLADSTLTKGGEP
jgi:hypothetical protein